MGLGPLRASDAAPGLSAIGSGPQIFDAILVTCVGRREHALTLYFARGDCVEREFGQLAYVEKYAADECYHRTGQGKFASLPLRWGDGSACRQSLDKLS